MTTEDRLGCCWNTLLHVTLCYFQSLNVDVRDNFDAAISSFKGRFDDATIHTAIYLQLHNF